MHAKHNFLRLLLALKLPEHGGNALHAARLSADLLCFGLCFGLSQSFLCHFFWIKLQHKSCTGAMVIRIRQDMPQTLQEALQEAAALRLYMHLGTKLHREQCKMWPLTKLIAVTAKGLTRGFFLA